MRPFERTIAQPLRAVVGGDDFMFDLPTEPFSYVDLIFQGLADPVNTVPISVFDILRNLERVDISYLGAEILSLSGEELIMYALAVQGFIPILTYSDSDDDQAFNVIVRIPFSRIAYNPLECYPATPAGSSEARVVFLATLTKVTTLYLEAVVCRLPDAKPKEFITVDRLWHDIDVVGIRDIHLPVAYPYAMLLMYSQRIPQHTLLTACIRYLSLKEDSDEIRLHRVPWQHLRSGLQEKMRNFNWIREHIHKVPVAPPAAGSFVMDQSWANDHYADHWGLVDFDPLLDRSHILDISRDHSLIARVTADIVGEVVFRPIILRPTAPLLGR